MARSIARRLGLGVALLSSLAWAAPARLALIATRGNASESALYFVEPDASELPAAVATFAHLPDATVRGALLPGTRVLLAVADRAPVRDHSFDASLLRVEAGRSNVTLCDRVDHASTPLVTSDGRVFVGRGRPGPSLPGELRVDELSIDEIDPASGAARVVFRARGHHASLAGAHGRELLVYFVGPGGASLLAVDRDGGAVRTIASLLPFARDFSLAGDALVFAERDEERHDLWVIDRLDLPSGLRTRLHRSNNQHLAPHVWPNGEVAFDGGGAAGLQLLGGNLHAPLGEGTDVLRAIAADGTRAAVWHYAPNAQWPDVGLLDASGRRAGKIVAPPSTRLEIVGFTSAAP